MVGEAPVRGGATRGYSGNKSDVLRRLRRTEGQVRGLQRMIDEDAYCIDVLTQASAVTKALQAVAVGLLQVHLKHCVADALVAGGAEGSERIEEAFAAVERLVRS